MSNDKGLKYNAEGYVDPTAYKAIKRAEADDRFNKFLSVIFDVCELSGYHLEERIVVKDLRTGEIRR